MGGHGLSGAHMMFCFDSPYLQARRAQLEVGTILRRLLDKSASDIPPGAEEARLTRRCKRVFPVFVVPWAEGTPDFRDAMLATTSELSDYGIGVVLSRPLQVPDLVIGMLVEQESFLLRGELKGCRSMGAGFWHVGIQAVGLIEPTTVPINDLLKFTAILAPGSWEQRSLPGPDSLRR
jgi:hypothetical protein